MTKTQIFFKVTLLQVIKRIIPPMGNEFINLVKDTALARTIAVYEVLWMGETYIESKGIIWPLFYTAVFYLVFNGLLTLLFRLDREEEWTILSKEAPKCLFLRSRTCTKTLARPRF